MRRVDRDLRHAAQAILDRVLECNQLAVGGIQRVEHTIKRRRLTRASRPDHQHQTARVADNFVDFLALARRNAQQVQVQQ